MFDALVAVGHRGIFGAGVIEFRHAVSQGFELGFQGAQIVEDRHALGENRAPGQREAVLGKVSGRGAFGDHERAVVEGVHAGENLHQRGLAGAVAADQADVIVVGNQPVDVFEEQFVAEAFSGAGKLDHISFRIRTGIIVTGAAGSGGSPKGFECGDLCFTVVVVPIGPCPFKVESGEARIKIY